MKMRIHAYDRSHDVVEYDVSIGGSGFGITVDIPEWEYDNIETILDEYRDLQEKLQKMYSNELNRLHFPPK